MIYKCPSFLVHPIITPIGPAVVAFILSYIISSIFVQIYIITLDTVMLCYCEDKKMHGEEKENMEGKIGGIQQATPEATPEGEATTEGEVAGEEVVENSEQAGDASQ